MSVFPDMYASLGLLPLSRCWVALSTPALATAKWVSTSFRSTRSSSVAEPERHRRKTHSDIKCGHRPTLPLVYWYNYKVGPVYPRDTYLQVFNCFSPSLSVAFLFEGTAEIALQNLTNLSEYTERKSKWESGVKFSVVQVKVPLVFELRSLKASS